MEVKEIISSGLLELYITGLTSDKETREVDMWAEQYPEVKQEIRDLQNVMERYALAEAVVPEDGLKAKILAKIHPADSVKDKIFSRIQAPKQEPFSVVRNTKSESNTIYSIPSYLKWAVAASIILLLGSLITNFLFYNKYQSADRKFQAVNKQYDSVYNIHKSDSNELLAAQQKLLQQKDTNSKSPNQFQPKKDDKEIAVKEVKQKENTEGVSTYANVAGDKFSVPVVLKGTKHTPDALAKIFWMKNTGEVYVDATFLPLPPQGKQYQLWAIVDGAPVDAGMITTPEGTYKIQKMKSFGSAEAFAITLENAGGSLTPTMKDMVVKAKI